jgi:hypothetical protein
VGQRHAGGGGQPESTKNSLTYRLHAHAKDKWPQLADLQVRYRANLAHVAGACSMLLSVTRSSPEQTSRAGVSMSLPSATVRTAMSLSEPYVHRRPVTMRTPSIYGGAGSGRRRVSRQVA